MGNISAIGGVGGSVSNDRLHLMTPLFGRPWTWHIPAELVGKISMSPDNAVISGFVGLTLTRLIVLAVFEGAVLYAFFMYAESLVWARSVGRLSEATEIVFASIIGLFLAGIVGGTFLFARRNAQVGADYLMRELIEIVSQKSA